MPSIVMPVRTDLDEIVAAGLGLKGQNWPLAAAGGTTGLASQVIFATGIPLRAGTVVSNLWVNVQTAAVGTVPTNAYVGLATPDAKVAAVSADVKASASWTTVAYQSFAVSYTVPSDGLYYGLLLINGTFGTTQPLLNRGAAVGSNIGTNFLYASAGTAKTSLGNVGDQLTLASTSSPVWFWCGVS